MPTSLLLAPPIIRPYLLCITHNKGHMCFFFSIFAFFKGIYVFQTIVCHHIMITLYSICNIHQPAIPKSKLNLNYPDTNSKNKKWREDFYFEQRLIMHHWDFFFLSNKCQLLKSVTYWNNGAPKKSRIGNQSKK